MHAVEVEETKHGMILFKEKMQQHGKYLSMQKFTTNQSHIVRV